MPRAPWAANVWRGFSPPIRVPAQQASAARVVRGPARRLATVHGACHASSWHVPHVPRCAAARPGHPLRTLWGRGGGADGLCARRQRVATVSRGAGADPPFSLAIGLPRTSRARGTSEWRTSYEHSFIDFKRGGPQRLTKNLNDGRAVKPLEVSQRFTTDGMALLRACVRARRAAWHGAKRGRASGGVRESERGE